MMMYEVLAAVVEPSFQLNVEIWASTLLSVDFKERDPNHDWRGPLHPELKGKFDEEMAKLKATEGLRNVRVVKA